MPTTKAGAWGGLNTAARNCRRRPLALPCLPCPPFAPAVTASQVPGSEGALALYLLPRYLLINTLEVPIQYKQQVGGWWVA